MMLAELSQLLAHVPEDAAAEEYKSAVIDANCLGKSTLSSRQRSYRYLRELYVLNPQQLGFRALRNLWPTVLEAQPLLALLSALARDPALRATADVVLATPQGEHVDAEMCARALQQRYPGYSDSVANKVGRNAASTWTQSGHLVGHYNKVRSRADCRPPAVAYALLLAHSQGRRGEALFDTLWCSALDRSREVLIEQTQRASQLGLLEFKRGGGVIEVGFRMLTRPFREESGE